LKALLTASGTQEEPKTRDPFAEKAWNVGVVNVAGLLQELLQVPQKEPR